MFRRKREANGVLMKIGILGAGNIGASAARLFIAAGHEVALSNSRGPETLQAFVDRIANALSAPTSNPRAQPIPQSIIDNLTAMASTAPISPALGASVADPANAQAFHNVALKVRDTPGLIDQPGMADVKEYLASKGAL